MQLGERACSVRSSGSLGVCESRASLRRVLFVPRCTRCLYLPGYAGNSLRSARDLLTRGGMRRFTAGYPVIVSGWRADCGHVPRCAIEIAWDRVVVLR